MTIRGVFIGVNKHADPRIGELAGACDDARALWSLFTDTIPELQARLLLDENATLASVRSSLIATLQDAGEEDVIVISFAGHGSSDGRVVLNDTRVEDLDNTTLPMPEIATAFETCRARAILCILDCCFSGQAPARVLETEGRARALTPFQGIYGEGRILLAACGPNESAWEQPGSGHGLLTYAIMEAFTDASLERIEFPDIGGRIIGVARVAAEQMGRTQTPEFLGHVQGGLVFPRLVRGDNFAASFPACTITAMRGEFAEFEAHGFPPEIVHEWQQAFPDGLNALQLRAVNEFGVLAGNSLLVVAPTSSGKTMIGELSAVQAVTAGKKAVFLLPYRALVNEKFQDFTARYEEAGLRIARCSGDATDGVATVLAGRYDIAFFTYEMFLNMALGSPRLLSQLGLVVVDEGQFITDPGRGINVELIFALLLRARSSGIEPQLLVLSAVIGNLNGFDQWLGIPVLRSDVRPVPLIEGVLDRRGIFQFVDADGTTRTEQLLEPHQIQQRKDKPSSQDVIVPLARKLVGNGEKLLVFRNRRGPAQGCAAYLAAELGLPPATSVLNAMPQQGLSSASHDVRACLEGGTAFHNTNLLRAEREAIERGYRSRDGGIHVLAATTTLAAGINTPASTVILAENQFVGEDGRPFTIAEYKNMAGRAGRLGWNETGKAIILADNGIERSQLFQRYVLGHPEDVRSSFQQSDLSTWVLRLLSQVKGVRQDDIPQLLVNTFGGYSASRANPNWVAHVSHQIAELVQRMLRLGLAEMQGDLVHLTLLGQACGSSSLSFESALRLVELLRGFNATDQTPMTVMALVQVLEEMDATYTPLFKKGRGESMWVAEASQRYGRDVMGTFQRFVPDEFYFWARSKRACILFDWLNGDDIGDMESRYTRNPFVPVKNGDINSIVDNTRFRLRSAHQIFAAMYPDQPAFLLEFAELLDRLEFGLPKDAMGLRAELDIPRGVCLALFHAGCRTKADVDALSVEQLEAIIGEGDARALRGAPSQASA